MSDIPKNWTICLIKELVIYQKGKKPDILSDQIFPNSVPYIDIKAFEQGIISQYADVVTSKRAESTDILVVWDGARSGLAGIGIEGAIGSTIMALKPILVDSKYLYRYIQTQYEILNSSHRGTGIPHVNPEIFWNLQVPLAALNEQKRIIVRLEKILKKLDECNQRLENVTNILKQFRQSVLDAACSGRLTANWREKNPNIESASELLLRINKERKNKYQYTTNAKKEIIQSKAEVTNGDLPISWKWSTIDNFASVCVGGTPSRKEPTYWRGKIPWVSSGEVSNNIISKTNENISEEGLRKSNCKLYPPGTVLLAMIGEGKTRGQTSILQIEATTNQNVAALLFDLKWMVSKYLWYWFHFKYEETRNIGQGGNQPALNAKKVKSLIVAVPPYDEQQEIVRRVEALLKLADQIEKRYKKAKAHVDKLQQAVLAKAFRGELVPQDPDDEPASVLLERIRTERSRWEAEAAAAKKNGNSCRAGRRRKVEPK